VPTIEHVKIYGYKWPEDVEWLKSSELSRYHLGARIAMPWTQKDYKKPKTSSMLEMREIIASQLNGKGVEFGAAADPLPVPLGCDVAYADILPSEPLNKRLYTNNDLEFVTTEIISNLESAENIQSVDFIIACHVIEHTHNPIKALVSCWEKLNKGGKLVLIVPHKEKTFDRPRELTTLKHLLNDFENPDINRDILHYVEFYTKATGYITPVEDLYTIILDNIQNKDGYIHYHTWTEKSFLELINYTQTSKLCDWSSVLIHNVRKEKNAYEFYVILEKKL
jgi:SAM-dependent methyltransferase